MDLSYFLCCCFNSKGYNRSKRKTMVINQDDIERSLEEWEHLLGVYSALEAAVAEKLGEKFWSKIISIRQNPQDYLDSEIPIIVELASKRVEVIKFEELLTSLHALTDADEEERTDITFSNKSDAKTHTFTDIDNTTNTISDIWANRLGELDPTQGSWDETTDNQGQNILRIKPKWPEWLVDEYFEVFKYNTFGKKFDRFLKLTQYQILAFQENKIATKVYGYLEVEKVYLKTIR